MCRRPAVLQSCGVVVHVYGMTLILLFFFLGVWYVCMLVGQMHACMFEFVFVMV